PRGNRTRRRGADDSFHHHCDEIVLTTAGGVVIKGWAVCPSPIATIEVFLDGETIGEADLGVARADVGNLFPSLPHARQSGFTFTRQTGKAFRDEHLIALRLRRGDGEGHDIELPVRATAAAPAAAVTSGDTAGDTERRLHLDAPALVGGVMEMPLRGNLEISGWALARAGVATIEIAIDGAPIANADYGIRRLDIQAGFPDWQNALGSGFLALVPHRILPTGEHRVSVTLRDKTDKTARLDFGIKVEELSDSAGPWNLRRNMPRAEADLALRLLKHRQWQPSFRIAMAIDSGMGSQACTTIESLRTQVYGNWQLVLAAAPKTLAEAGLRAALDSIAGRIEIAKKLTTQALLDDAADNTAFVTVLAPGDELGCDAFLEMALTTVVHRNTDFLYSDERRF